MKSIQLARLFLGAGLVSSVFAAPVSQPLSSAGPSPTPIVVVEPTRLPRSFPGGILQLEFALDDSGHSRDIQLNSVYDARVNQQVLKAFSQWQFAPAQSKTATEPKHCLLPLEVKPQ
jgi:hypothetical protein